jgi:MFS family permease
MSQVFAHPPLIVYASGGFLMNFFMTAFFFHFPLMATNQHHLRMNQYYLLLLPMMVISGLTMFGFSQGADKGWGRPLSAFAYLLFLPSFVLLFAPAWLHLDPARLLPMFLAGTLFYIGFTGLEPILPSLVSRAAPGTAYGTSLGFYNTAQFLGSAVSGPLAGALASHALSRTLYIMLAAAAVGFLIMAATKAPAGTQPQPAGISVGEA